MICVVDYGMGNLRSVSKALEKAGGKVQVSSDPADLERADKIVLPGVGAFGEGASELRRRQLFGPLQNVIREGKKPFLGICLGLQLLFEASEESPEAAGLGILAGKVQKFRSRDVKVPHMGWNEVEFSKPGAKPWKGLKQRDYFYFVHSFYAMPEEPTLLSAATEYGGERFASFLERGALWASQFHPEKSQDAGLQILKNFVAF